MCGTGDDQRLFGIQTVEPIQSGTDHCSVIDERQELLGTIGTGGGPETSARPAGHQYGYNVVAHNVECIGLRPSRQSFF